MELLSVFLIFSKCLRGIRWMFSLPFSPATPRRLTVCSAPVPGVETALRIIFVLMVSLCALILVAGLRHYGHHRGSETAMATTVPPSGTGKSGDAQPEVRRAIAVSTEVKSSSLPVGASVPSGSSGTVYVVAGLADGDALNVRSGPGVNHKVVARLANGYGGIQVVGATVMNAKTPWVQIRFNDQVGWVVPSYLKPM